MKKVRFRLSFKIGIAVVLVIILIGIVLAVVINKQYRDIYVSNETTVMQEKGVTIGQFIKELYGDPKYPFAEEFGVAIRYLVSHQDEADALLREKLEKDGDLTNLYSDIDLAHVLYEVDDYVKLYTDLESYPSPDYDKIRLVQSISTAKAFCTLIGQRTGNNDHYEIRVYDNTKHYCEIEVKKPDELNLTTEVSYSSLSYEETDTDELPGLEKALSEKDIHGLYTDPYVKDSDDNYYMYVYTPMFFTKNYSFVLVAIEDWTNMYKTIDESVFRIVNGIIIMLVVLLILIIVLMHEIITKKTIRMQRAIIAYEESGDVEAFSKSIEKTAKGTDEINLLSSELLDMAKSIDENIQERSRIAAENEKQRTEMEIAASIQRGNLLSDFKTVTEGLNIELYASMTPLREVGGDYYGCVRPDDDHIAFLIADVSDKGIPAAMFMMNSKGMIERELMDGKSPADVLNYVNDTIDEGNDADMFVTVWLCLLTVSTGECRIVNAGHENPVVKKQGSDWQFVDYYMHFLPVGSIPGVGYTEHTYALEHGDIVFVYTDGVTDAETASGDRFGEDRLLQVLNGLSSENPEEIIGGMTEELDAFTDGVDPFDDITMLCFRY